jgi:hypothetical protein
MGCEVSRHDARVLTGGQLTIPAGSVWAKLPVIGAVLALVGIGAAYGLGASDTKQLYHSWLVSYLYFLSLALGGLFFVIVQFAARAGWSVVVRRMAENVMATLPVFVLLFVPIALGLHDLYHWTHGEAVEGDPILKWKSGYLNEQFFFIRAAGYFAVWALLSFWYYRKSTGQDASGDPETTRKMQIASGPSIFLFAMSITFAAFDWIMSLDPHWYSTMFGVYYFAGSVVAIFALLAVITIAMRSTGLLDGVVTTEHLHDLGKLVFGFTVFWTYIAFSQYFLIWYANIPEETVWYTHRWGGSWTSVTLLLALGHFVVPFFFMLPRTIKRNRLTLMIGACWMLFMHFVDLYWLVMPNLHHDVHVSVIDVAAFVGIGGVFLAAFGVLLRRHALIPVKDPRLPESLGFENF